MGHWLLQSAEVQEVVQAAEFGQARGVTSAAIESRKAYGVTSIAAEVSDDPIVVVELVTFQLMKCRLGGTSVEHP
jgi:hypothetical protein